MGDDLLTCDSRQRWEGTDEHEHDFQRGGGPVGLWMACREKGPGTHSQGSLKMEREGAEEHGFATWGFGWHTL